MAKGVRNILHLIAATYLPWRLMSDMRNVMAHEYFQVNLRLIWGTIQNNLPPLVTQLQNLLQQKEE